MSIQLILGTAQLARPYGVLAPFRRVPPRQEAVEMVGKAQAHGFIAVDTAPAYGQAEEIIGESSSEIPIHTKFAWGKKHDDSVRESLKRVGSRALSCVYFHEEFEANQRQRAGLSYFERGQRGEILELGASIYSLEEFERVLNFPEITIIQAPGSVLDRRFLGEVTRRAKEAGKSMIVRSTLLQGLLVATGKHEINLIPPLSKFLENFQQVCVSHSLSVVEGAIGYLKRAMPEGTLVVGATSLAEMEEISHSVQANLSDRAFNDFDGLPIPPASAVDPRNWVSSR